VSPIDFALEQILSANPLTAPLWVGGVVFGLASPAARQYRSVVWIFATVFLLLAFSGSARPHYLAPAYPMAFAAGAVAVARQRLQWRWLPMALATGMVLVAVISAPLAMPLLPPDLTVRYQDALGLRPREELERGGLLPMHLGLFFHAEAVLAPVLQVYQRLTPEEQAHVEILTGSFGETGAINVLGRSRGLPGSIGRHNQYWLWGPGAASGELMIVVHDSEKDLHEWFTACERRAEIECPYCMEIMQHNAVYLCRHPRRPLAELWPQLKHYR